MGHVKCFNYLNGAMMKDARPHTENISDMIYSRCIITVSWDRKIVVLDEEPGEDDIPIPEQSQTHTVMTFLAPRFHTLCR